MSRTWWHDFRDRVEPEVIRFANETGYTVDPQQPEYRGGTNVVTFARDYGNHPLVIKYFVNDRRWVNEVACTRHFEPTGTIAPVLNVLPGKIMVTPALTGCDALHSIRTTDPAKYPELARQLGRALGKLATTPLPQSTEAYNPMRDFTCVPWLPSFRENVERTLACAWRIVRQVPQLENPVFQQSLQLMESRLEQISRAKLILWHEDITNAKFDDGSFIGFFDLEMCRVGIEHCMTGIAFCGDGMLAYDDVLAGYAEQTGRCFDEGDLLTILAVELLYPWIRACKWGNWNGSDDHLASAAGDANWMREALMRSVRFMSRHVNLKDWFATV